MSFYTKYDTHQETINIAKFLNANKELLHIYKIQELIGVHSHMLGAVMSGKCKSIRNESLIKLLPILERVGFRRLNCGFTIDEVVWIMCMYFRVDRFKICNRSRNGEIIKMRQLTTYFIIKKVTNNYNEIGEYLTGLKKKGKGFDYSTIAHSYKTILGLIKVDCNFARKVKEIEDKYFTS